MVEVFKTPTSPTKRPKTPQSPSNQYSNNNNSHTQVKMRSKSPGEIPYIDENSVNEDEPRNYNVGGNILILYRTDDATPEV